MQYSQKQNGFTLVELMIVVAIISILAGIAVPKFQAFQARARQAEAKANLGHIHTLEHSYLAEADSYAAISAIGRGNCATKNVLGFMPDPCVKSRYSYTVTIGAGGKSFAAQATTGTGAANRVFPGCADADVWEMNEEKSLLDKNNAMAKCS